MGGNPFNRGWFGAVPSSASPVCAQNESSSSVTPGWVPNNTKDDTINDVSTNEIDFESALNFSLVNGAGYTPIEYDLGNFNYPFTPPPGKPFSGHHYAYLGLNQPNGLNKIDLKFKTVASGNRNSVSFMLYRAYITLNGSYDKSGAISSKVEILDKNNNMVISQELDKSCNEQTAPGTYSSGYMTFKYPPNVYPVFKACDYEKISIPIPNGVHQGEEMHIRWTLTTGSDFFNPNLWETSCPNGPNIYCFEFKPGFSFSIDDIALDDKPVPPNFTCDDKLEIAPNGDPHCKLDAASTDNPLYFLRVTKAEEQSGPATVSRIFKTLTGFNFSRPGDYTVDAICQQPLVNGTQGICGHSAMKAKIKVSDPNSKPLAARLTETTAVVFPPLTPPQCNPREPQRIISYEIYRLNSPGDPPS